MVFRATFFFVSSPQQGMVESMRETGFSATSSSQHARASSKPSLERRGAILFGGGHGWRCQAAKSRTCLYCNVATFTMLESVGEEDTSSKATSETTIRLPAAAVVVAW